MYVGYKLSIYISCTLKLCTACVPYLFKKHEDDHMTFPARYHQVAGTKEIRRYFTTIRTPHVS